VLEVHLVVLDPADRERQLHLQRPDRRVGLVRRGEVDAVQRSEDLVPLAHVALVQLVVGLDGLSRDAVELQQRGLQLAGRDLLEGGLRHGLLRSGTVRGGEHNG
jgi:hypothetical protein